MMMVLAAATSLLPRIQVNLGTGSGGTNAVLTLQVIALLTVLTLAPSLLVLLTSFTRIVVVLSFVRSALATNQVPPNQVIVGLALFLTFFIMTPTWTTVYQQAIQPYLAGEVTEQQALQRATGPIRQFMLRATRQKDLALFWQQAPAAAPDSQPAQPGVGSLAPAPPVQAAATQTAASGGPNPDEVPMTALIPAFLISELKTAFQLAFVIYIPFLVIDLVVASSLMSMGMIMLPPVMISLPFKILLFVLADGWNLIVGSLLRSYQ